MNITDIALAASFAPYDGYGLMSIHLGWHLTTQGVRIHQHFVGDTLDHWDAQQPIIFFHPVTNRLDHYRERTQNLFVNTMYEATRVPDFWRRQLDNVRGIIVPSRFCEQMLRDSGVSGDITVIPEGFDPSWYPYQDRPHRKSVTTLVVGTYQPRKNHDIAIAAWKQAFAGDPDARLFIKTSFHFPLYPRYAPDDPRILYVCAKEETDGLAHWYRNADVLLALGSEGFGLPMIEAMASGLPVIAMDAAGQHDACEDAGPSCLLTVPAAGTKPHDCPVWGKGVGETFYPSADAVAEKLRWVADNPDWARTMGSLGSRWAHAKRTIALKGPRVLDYLYERAA